MDAYQSPQSFMRPPPSPTPPPTADPYHHHHQIPARPPPPPPPQGHHNWYSSQFQFSPSPPPPQWGPPPPPPPPPGSYPPPPQHPYQAPPSSAHHSYQLPPPPPPQQHAPRQSAPPPHSHFPPQSYAQHNHEWGTQNWGHQQGWDYQARSNEEDWAARARAWADANKAMENQHPQPQIAPVGRVDEQNYYHQQYTNSVGSYYTEVQHQPLPASGYQQGPVSTTPLHQPPVNHPSEFPSISHDSSSYVQDGHLHTVREATSAADSNAMIQRQENLPKSPSVHPQEVPSSYSSVTGNDGGMLPLSNSASQEGLHHVQPPPAMPLADQPLEFATRFNRDDPNVKSNYSYADPVGPMRGMDTVAVPSMNNWTASMPYAPVPSVLPPGSQHHDPTVAMPPLVPGPPLPPFSSFPGSGLQPAIPSAGAPFGLGAGAALQPNTTFSGDAYGIPSLSERPKKAAVPNWLKEEIKKAVITGSSLDQVKDETQSTEAEVLDTSVGNVDREDSKSIDSSRSAEEDEDDEDYVDAAKSAAINQEIKRILTEVLLKVTDELFDEIATKVIDEDNNSTNEADKSKVSLNHKVSLSSPTVPPPKAAGKLLVPGKSTESETIGNTEKSSSISHGVLLGLANYATDDDDDEDETEDISSPNSRKNVLQHSTSDDRHVNANGSSSVQSAGISGNQPDLASEPSKANSVESKHSKTRAVTDFNYEKNRKIESGGGGTADFTIPSRSKDGKGIDRFESPEDDHSGMKSLRDNNQVKETKTKADKNDGHENKKSSGRDIQEEESGAKRADEKGNGKHRRHDERHSRRDKTEELSSSKDRRKEEKAHDSESKKRSSHVNDKEDKKETERERHHRAGAKEENSRKREHAKDKEDDRYRHKHASDSSRHKKRHSSSVTRGRSSKETSGYHDNDTSDDASDDSMRKRHSRRRNLSRSPSPFKSRRRQVSRSPISKHSQRRPSPYSSLDTNRGKRSRSRSRSPVRRHR